MTTAPYGVTAEDRLRVEQVYLAERERARLLLELCAVVTSLVTEAQPFHRHPTGRREAKNRR